MILVIDDEKYIRSSLVGLLQDENYAAEAVSSAFEAEEYLNNHEVDLILLDIQMPGKDGLTFLEDNREKIGSTPVIIISGRGDIKIAVTAIKMGCYDYIEKPLIPERVLITVGQALRLAQSVRHEQKLTGRLIDRYQIIGTSSPIVKLRKQIEKAGQSSVPVLIQGPSGSGKELVAHQIHYYSERRAEAIVAVNCPAVPESLFETELFGHIKGAYTGAVADRTGRVEKANGGTLFLDEIGELPVNVQAKLLRVLESGTFEKIGSDKTIASDFRLISATNKDLTQLVNDNVFRQDLYYRLNVLIIDVPGLDERKDDIPLLADYFLDLYAPDHRYILSADACGVLAAMTWPGNVRQLKNFIQQLMFAVDPGEITAAHIHDVANLEISEMPDSESGANRLSMAVRNFENGYLSRLFVKHDGNIAAIARELNMDRGNLSRKLKSHKIM